MAPASRAPLPTRKSDFRAKCQSMLALALPELARKPACAFGYHFGVCSKTAQERHDGAIHGNKRAAGIAGVDGRVGLDEEPKVPDAERSAR
jgi:hypothetical protein